MTSLTGEQVCIALGSNLGDRRATMEAAINALRAHPSILVERVSRFHETDPVAPPDAPAAPAARQPTFLNAAAVLRTTLSPRALLDTLLAIEHEHGRVREDAEKWGPRTLDLDLLLYGERVIDEPGLTVPHPRMHRRLFVLAPLAEVAGHFLHPVLGRRVESLVTDIGSRSPDAQGAHPE